MDFLIKLDFTDLACALGMMAIAIGLSSWQKLGLEGQLAIAAVRTVVQLLGVGCILAVVFASNNPWIVLGILILLLTADAIVARNRISKKIPQLFPIVWGSIFISAALTLSYTIFLVIQPTTTWYDPQYLIPLAGSVLGNAMNAAALCGERLASTIAASQLEIETHLSLGATPKSAIAQYRKEAIRAALIPTLNTMMVVGIVTLPEIITGQLLSGTDPLQAAAYQIVIMIMVAFTSLSATLLVTQGLQRQFFNQNLQLKKF
ncbi:iron export ABC transporter permease subunit FetB [Microcoleus sp. FACHB-831]|uniref:ABC transporter permease n=1 Tax=Microcoleus sp. FACHB-831 TaxID=2692827 RepID=UPI001684EF86|nr:iron export ABC transporter permease subunit FetB [Microcoleus sp. FACHB-831]MBD1924337.1 iron export ABC transporter permease subunit FetB [Microcoleus sp. FACHB-831]